MKGIYPKSGRPPSSSGIIKLKKARVGNSLEGVAISGPIGGDGAARGRVTNTEVQGEGALPASPYRIAIL